MNKSITGTDIELVIKTCSKNTRYKEYTLLLWGVSQEKRICPTKFYQANITPIPKPEKDIRKLQNNTPYEYKCRNSQPTIETNNV